MKDTNPTSGDWRPGKQGVNLALTTNMVNFLTTCVAEMDKAYVEAENPQQMLNLLEGLGWAADQAQTKFATYDNRTRSLRTGERREIRFAVTFSSAGHLTWAVREWWRP